MMIYSRTKWMPKHYDMLDIIGFIPSFITDSSAPLRPQLNIGYAHGGGWRPMSGWTIDDQGRIKYPGDPTIAPWVIGKSSITGEELFVYPSAWVRVGDEISRMD